jgi:uncharacterized oligopeptide transporter (OPT) family protein
MIGIGAAIAAVVIALDVTLEKRGSSIRTPVMAFAVGVYLPFELSTPILLGGFIAHLVSRKLKAEGANPARHAQVERDGLLFSAGLITGESLMGIAIAIPIAAKHDDMALALFDGKYAALRAPGLLLVAVCMFLTFRAALRKVTTPTP